MERLTDTDNYLKSCIKCKDDDCNICSAQIDAFNKLAEYEDAEEQGFLLRLPCKIDNTVYLLLEKLRNGKKEIVESRFVGYRLHPQFELFSCYIDCKAIGNTLEFHREDFGKTIFLTKEEAEAKLKELERSEDK